MEIHSERAAIRKVDITLESGEVEENVGGLVFFDKTGRVQLVMPEWAATGMADLRSGDTVVLTIFMDHPDHLI